MKKNNQVVFYSRGFAFNRLNRIKAYVKMFHDMQVVLITTNKWGDIHKWKDTKNLKIIELSFGIKGIMELFKYFKKNKVISVNNLGNRKSLPLLYLNKKINKTPYIATANLLEEIPLRYKLFYNYADKIISNDKRTAKFFQKTKYAKRAYYLPAPVDKKRFHIIDRKKARKKLKLPKNKPIALFVGRISKWKGSDFLYKSILKNPEILFVTVGKINDNKFKNLKKKNYIHVGEVVGQKVVDYFNAADMGFFYILHNSGGYSMVGQECLMCGTPILVPKFKLQDDVKFVVGTKKNIKEISNGLKKLLELSNKNQLSLRKKIRKFAIKEYSFQNWTKEYRRVWLEN
jgi:glycosyltransferase involved in cell wall biosynthesis